VGGYDPSVGRGLVLAALLAVMGIFAGSASAATRALTPAQYKAQLATIGKESNQSQALITKGLKAKTVPALVGALTQFAKAQDKVAAEVAALKPPANATTANQALAKGLRDIATAVRSVAGRLKVVKTMREAAALLNKDTSGVKAGQEVDAALTKLGKLGYSS
jgi:hypothetical protein